VRLFGRQREREVLDRVLEAARKGYGGVLAVYGERGVGKTALLDYATEAGADFPGGPRRRGRRGDGAGVRRAPPVVLARDPQ
jgi:AAA ATPase domain